MDIKFDTKVQEIKYQTLREVARLAWNDELTEHIFDIPKMIIPGKTPSMRCCVYKERAILQERVKLAMGRSKEKHIINVIDIACDDCPAGGYAVTNACRGCLAHRCEQVCPKHAIIFDEFQRAHIDKSKCIECGMCAKSCPYTAIVHQMRPCQIACKVKAIDIAEDKSAMINYDKCISCGSCVYQCPFGAISDKSFILQAIKLIKESNNNQNYKVYAIVAPSIASQFKGIKLGKVVSGIKKLGFHTVIETALGADIVAYREAKELKEKGFLTSSCCPAFVSYIKKNFPGLAEHISSNPSPMVTLGQVLKEQDPSCKVIFIGPCTAKKEEILDENNAKYIDVVLTFEELQALFSSKDIDISTLEEEPLNNASYFGRIFARSGGLSDAVKEAIIEQGETDFVLNAKSCNGIEECKVALTDKAKGVIDANFIEGMACVGGCSGGACILNHTPANVSFVNRYGQEAIEVKITDSISQVGIKK